MTLSEALDETVSRFPNEEAIVFKEKRITFGQLQENGVRLAKSFLKLGVQKQDKIGIWMPNCPEWIYAKDAAIRAGAWWVPINSRFKAMELESILRHADVSTLATVDEALGIDFVSILDSVCPEVKQSEPGKISSAKLPHLKNVICLGKNNHPGMFAFGDLLDAGSECPGQSLEERTASIKPHDNVNITYSSGTTGVPKGVLLTHAQFLRAQAAMARRLGTTEKDCLLMTAPLSTLMGTMTGVTHSQMYGVKMVLVESWNSGEVLNLIEKERCSLFQGAPAMYRMLMDDADFTFEKVRSMRAGSIGGAPFSPELAERITAQMGIKLFSAYGMTENSGITTMSETEDPPALVARTVGRKIHEDVELKIVEPATGSDLPAGQPGEILTRGWFVTPGYYKSPEETARSLDAEGWYHTGDLGVLDDNGYLQIVGRLKNLIISGGFNIVPAEVESILAQHPAVAQAEAVGIPDYRMGEVVMAFVIVKPGMRCQGKEIIEFCSGKIANFKIPKYITFVDDFPVSAYGKVQKFKLREMAIKELGLEAERSPEIGEGRLCG